MMPLPDAKIVVGETSMVIRMSLVTPAIIAKRKARKRKATPEPEIPPPSEATEDVKETAQT